MPTRKTILATRPIAAVALVTATVLMAYEQPVYETLEREGAIELRRYQPYVVAETTTGGDYDRAMNEAFRRLFRYISGKQRQQVDPDAPKIAMTAPVTMAQAEGEWRMAFMMPSEYTAESAPRPADPQVEIREEPGGLVAALTYSGRWTRERYLERQAELELWLAERGLEATGAAMFAGYNSPFTPWFLRRNEVLIPVAEVAQIADPGGGG